MPLHNRPIPVETERAMLIHEVTTDLRQVEDINGLTALIKKAVSTGISDELIVADHLFGYQQLAYNSDEERLTIATYSNNLYKLAAYLDLDLIPSEPEIINAYGAISKEHLGKLKALLEKHKKSRTWADFEEYLAIARTICAELPLIANTHYFRFQFLEETFTDKSRTIPSNVFNEMLANLDSELWQTLAPFCQYTLYQLNAIKNVPNINDTAFESTYFVRNNLIRAGLGIDNDQRKMFQKNWDYIKEKLDLEVIKPTSSSPPNIAIAVAAARINKRQALPYKIHSEQWLKIDDQTLQYLYECEKRNISYGTSIEVFRQIRLPRITFGSIPFNLPETIIQEINYINATNSSIKEFISGLSAKVNKFPEDLSNDASYDEYDHYNDEDAPDELNFDNLDYDEKKPRYRIEETDDYEDYSYNDDEPEWF